MRRTNVSHPPSDELADHIFQVFVALQGVKTPIARNGIKLGFSLVLGSNNEISILNLHISLFSFCDAIIETHGHIDYDLPAGIQPRPHHDR